MSDTECRADRICHEGRCRFIEEVRAELHHENVAVSADPSASDASTTAAQTATPTATHPATTELPMFMGGPEHRGR